MIPSIDYRTFITATFANFGDIIMPSKQVQDHASLAYLLV